MLHFAWEKKKKAGKNIIVVAVYGGRECVHDRPIADPQRYTNIPVLERIVTYKHTHPPASAYLSTHLHKGTCC